MIDATVVLDALEQEALTAELEGRHIDELDPAAGSSLWMLGCFKLIMADTLYRVARAVREGTCSDGCRTCHRPWTECVC